MGILSWSWVLCPFQPPRKLQEGWNWATTETGRVARQAPDLPTSRSPGAKQRGCPGGECLQSIPAKETQNIYKYIQNKTLRVTSRWWKLTCERCDVVEDVAKVPEATQPFPAFEPWLAPPTTLCLCPWLAETEGDWGVLSGWLQTVETTPLLLELLLMLLLLVVDWGFWAPVKLQPPCVCFTCPPPDTLKGGRKVLGVLGENWCCCCWVEIIWWESGFDGEDDGEGEDEGGGVGAGGRGVSLMMGEELLLCEDLVRVACMGVMKLGWWWRCVWDLPWAECAVWEVGEDEEVAGDGGQKDCKPWWEVELERDWGEGEEEAVTLLLTALPLLLDLVLLFPSAWLAPIVPSIPTGLAKPFWWGGSRGEAVGGGRCFGGEGEGCGCIFPITVLGRWLGDAMVTCLWVWVWPMTPDPLIGP